MKTLTTLLLLTITLSCNTTKSSSSDDAKAMPILSGAYSLVTMNNKDLTGSSIELTFNAESSSLSGSSGCNKLFGSYVQDGNALSFSGLGSTKMFCEGRMDLEQEFTQGLQVVNSTRLNNGTLELMNGDKVLMTFKEQQ